MVSHTLDLGGRTWTLPPLPWRIVRDIQPPIAAFFDAAGVDGTKIFRLSTDQLDAIAGVVYRAAAHVERSMTREQFDDLPFAPADIVRAIPIVACAAGLIKAGAEAPDPLPPDQVRGLPPSPAAPPPLNP